MGRAWKCATQAELPELLQGHLLLEAPGLSGEGPRFLRLSPWRGRTCGAEAGGVERCPPRGTLYFLALPCSVTTDQRGTGRERVSSTATQRRGSLASGPRPGVSEAAQGGRHPRFRASSDGYPTRARVQTTGVFKTICANASSLARGERTHGGSPWKQQQLQARHGTPALPRVSGSWTLSLVALVGPPGHSWSYALLLFLLLPPSRAFHTRHPSLSPTAVSPAAPSPLSPDGDPHPNQGRTSGLAVFSQKLPPTATPIPAGKHAPRKLDSEHGRSPRP